MLASPNWCTLDAERVPLSRIRAFWLTTPKALDRVASFDEEVIAPLNKLFDRSRASPENCGTNVSNIEDYLERTLEAFNPAFIEALAASRKHKIAKNILDYSDVFVAQTKNMPADHTATMVVDASQPVTRKFKMTFAVDHFRSVASTALHTVVFGRGPGCEGKVTTRGRWMRFTEKALLMGFSEKSIRTMCATMSHRRRNRTLNNSMCIPVTKIILYHLLKYVDTCILRHASSTLYYLLLNAFPPAQVRARLVARSVSKLVV